MEAAAMEAMEATPVMTTVPCGVINQKINSVVLMKGHTSCLISVMLMEIQSTCSTAATRRTTFMTWMKKFSSCRTMSFMMSTDHPCFVSPEKCFRRGRAAWVLANPDGVARRLDREFANVDDAAADDDDDNVQDNAEQPPTRKKAHRNGSVISSHTQSTTKLFGFHWMWKQVVPDVASSSCRQCSVMLKEERSHASMNTAGHPWEQHSNRMLVNAMECFQGTIPN